MAFWIHDHGLNTELFEREDVLRGTGSEREVGRSVGWSVGLGQAGGGRNLSRERSLTMQAYATSAAGATARIHTIP